MRGLAPSPLGRVLVRAVSEPSREALRECSVAAVALVAAERPPRGRRLFHERMEQLTAIFDETNWDLDNIAGAVAAPG